MDDLEDLDALLPELEELLQDFEVVQPRWKSGFTLIGGFGYRDNVWYSPAREKGSVFARAGADMLLMRTGGEWSDFHLYGMAEHSRFLSDRSLPSESLAMALMNWKAGVSPNWRAGVALRGFYADQVMDLSTEQVDLPPVDLKGAGLELRPYVRHLFSKGLYAEASLLGGQQYYERPLHDYSEGGARIEAGRESANYAVSLVYEWVRRWYDGRVALGLDEVAVEGSELSLDFHRVEAVFRPTFGREQQWRGQTRLGVEEQEDRNTGFLDYTRLRAGQRISYQREGWELWGLARATWHSYDSQPAEFGGTDRRRRRALDFEAGVRRQVAEAVSVTLEYQREQVERDRRVGDYSVNTVFSAVHWEL